jgi:hypothetical protein
MTWRELIEDPKTKRLSSARFNTVLAGTTLSTVTIVLTPAAYSHPEVIPALIVAIGSITTLATGSYVVQKFTDRNNGKDRNET